MVYVGILLSIAIMGGVISMAFNKKSNFATRVASLIALGLMMLTIIICLVIGFTDNKVAKDESVLIVGAPEVVKKPDKNSMMILFLLIIVLVGFFAVIAILSLKDHKKINANKQDSADSISSLL